MTNNKIVVLALMLGTTFGNIFGMENAWNSEQTLAEKIRAEKDSPTHTAALPPVSSLATSPVPEEFYNRVESGSNSPVRTPISEDDKLIIFKAIQEANESNSKK